MSACQSYPSDMSDDEWALVALNLTSMSTSVLNWFLATSGAAVSQGDRGHAVEAGRSLLAHSSAA